MNLIKPKKIKGSNEEFIYTSGNITEEEPLSKEDFINLDNQISYIQ